MDTVVEAKCEICEGVFPVNTLLHDLVSDDYMCNTANARRCFSTFVVREFGKEPDEAELEKAQLLADIIEPTLMEG